MKAVSEQKRRRVPFTFVPIPKTLFTWLAELTDAELRVYMAIAANTLAFNRFSARIPMSVLSAATGLHRSNISRAIHSLEERGILRLSGARKQVTLYEVMTPPMISGNVAPALHETEFHVA